MTNQPACNYACSCETPRPEDIRRASIDTFFQAATYSQDVFSAYIDRMRDELPFDTEKEYSGWGGASYHGTEPGVERTPIIFAHGANGSAAHFNDYADYFLEAGYNGDELWAITFSSLVSSHEKMRTELNDYADNVMKETGADQIDLVGHSRGVTGSRCFLTGFGTDTDGIADVSNFIGIAGANHGTVWSNSFLSPSSARDGPLHDLNTPDETPGDVNYYTVRGSADRYFVPGNNLDSPRLEGAEENLCLPGRTHLSTKDSQDVIETVYNWLQG